VEKIGVRGGFTSSSEESGVYVMGEQEEILRESIGCENGTCILINNE
jgi:hypothetical protein